MLRILLWKHGESIAITPLGFSLTGSHPILYSTYNNHTVLVVHAVQRLECGLCVSLCHLALPLCPNYLHRGCEADPHSHAGGVVAISEDLLINSLDSSLTSTLTNIHSRVRQAANIYLLLMDHEKPEVVLPRI